MKMLLMIVIEIITLTPKTRGLPKEMKTFFVCTVQYKANKCTEIDGLLRFSSTYPCEVNFLQ